MGGGEGKLGRYFLYLLLACRWISGGFSYFIGSTRKSIFLYSKCGRYFVRL